MNTHTDMLGKNSYGLSTGVVKGKREKGRSWVYISSLNKYVESVEEAEAEDWTRFLYC